MSKRVTKKCDFELLTSFCSGAVEFFYLRIRVLIVKLLIGILFDNNQSIYKQYVMVTLITIIIAPTSKQIMFIRPY